MYNLDTKEEVDMYTFLKALENGEVIIDGRGMTEEDHRELSREIAEYRAMHKKEKAEKELVFV